MLNNFYFDKEAVNVGPKGSNDYLAKEFNYTFPALMEDFGVSEEELEEDYDGNQSAKEFVDGIMHWLFREQKLNYFNLILSDQHPEVT